MAFFMMVIGAMEHKLKKYLCKVPIQIYSIIYFVFKYTNKRSSQILWMWNIKKSLLKYFATLFVWLLLSILWDPLFSQWNNKKCILWEQKQFQKILSHCATIAFFCLWLPSGEVRFCRVKNKFLYFCAEENIHTQHIKKEKSKNSEAFIFFCACRFVLKVNWNLVHSKKSSREV